jgi:hypothetical protein
MTTIHAVLIAAFQIDGSNVYRIAFREKVSAACCRAQLKKHSTSKFEKAWLELRDIENEVDILPGFVSAN